MKELWASKRRPMSLLTLDPEFSQKPPDNKIPQGLHELLLLAQEVGDQAHAHQRVHTHCWGMLQECRSQAPSIGSSGL